MTVYTLPNTVVDAWLTVMDEISLCTVPVGLFSGELRVIIEYGRRSGVKSLLTIVSYLNDNASTKITNASDQNHPS